MSIEKQIREYIEEFILYGEELSSDDESLVESGMIDSTGAMEMVAFAEGEFKIEIPNAAISPENLDTVNKLSALVRSIQNGSNVVAA